MEDKDYLTQWTSFLEEDCPLVSSLLQHINRDKDPSTGGWFLMSSPLTPILIAILYLGTIIIGSRVFKDRQWFDEDKLLGILHKYNMALVILNLLLGFFLAYEIKKADYSLFCQPVSRDPSGVEMRIAYLVYIFHLSKIIELFDTVFHVVRRKFEQLTFLHLYHHSSMVVATWLGVRYVPGGSIAIIAMINSWVHVLMYIYYQLCLRNRNKMNMFSNYKKFITLTQMTQFCITLCVCTSVLLNGCDFPAWVAISLALYMLTFIALFMDFAIRKYL